MLQILFFTAAMLMPLSHSARANGYSITREIDLQEEFPRTPIVLKNGNLFLSRQNKDDWMIIGTDGSVQTIAANGGSTPAYLETPTGEIIAATKDGLFHVLDSNGSQIREFPAIKKRYIWSMAQRPDGVIVSLANRIDVRKVYGSVQFTDLNSQLTQSIDLGSNAVFSLPVILPDQSVALKTQSHSVFIVSPGATVQRIIGMGNNGDWIIDELSDGTLVTAGRFGTQRKVLFVDPITGKIRSEMSWDASVLEQDIGFLQPLPNGRLAVSFAEYEKVNGTTHYHERLEFYDSNRQLMNTFRIRDCGFDIGWGIQSLPDGRLVHGATRQLVFFDSDGNHLDTLPIPANFDKKPIIGNDGTIYVIGSLRNAQGNRETRLFFVSP